MAEVVGQGGTPGWQKESSSTASYWSNPRLAKESGSTASYWSVVTDGRKLTDAVWCYPQAEGDCAAVSGYLSFQHDELVTEVD